MTSSKNQEYSGHKVYQEAKANAKGPHLVYFPLFVQFHPSTVIRARAFCFISLGELQAKHT